jgi:6-phosphogluconolactonase (cycloisomerase 2 family)
MLPIRSLPSHFPPSPPPARRRLGSVGLAAGILLGLASVALQACGGGSGGGSGGGLEPPSGLAYSESSYLLRLGQTFSSGLPSVTGTDLSFSIDPPLPVGLLLDPANGRLLGSPNVFKHRQAYRITASNPAGAVQAVVELEVVAPARFAYVANAADATLSIAQMDSELGRLQPISFLALDGADERPEALVVHQSGAFGWCALAGSGELLALELDAASGRIQAGLRLPVGDGPFELALRPDGRFLYLLSKGTGQLQSFAVAADSGALSAVGAPIGIPGQPSSLRIDPLGRTLVVARGASSSIACFRLDLAGGTPSPAGSISVPGGSADDLAFGPDGRHLYACRRSGDRLLHFALAPDTGQLSLRGELPTGTGPAAIAVHPRGRFLATLDLDGASLSRFALAEDGAPEALAPAELPEGVERILFEASGAFAHGIDPEGHSLVLLEWDPVARALLERERTRVRGEPASLAVLRSTSASRPRASHAYVVNQASNSVTSFRIQASSGQLVAPDSQPAGSQPTDIALDPWGRFAFVSNSGSGTVSRYAIEADGRLSSLGMATLVGGSPTALFVEPSGRFLYVTDTIGDQVLQLGIGNDGSLGPLSASPVLEHPIDVESSPNGEFLYVLNRDGDGGISSFRVDPRSGALTSIGTAVATSGPNRIEFDRGGRRAYAALTAGNIVVPYSLDPLSGELSFIPPGSRPDSQPKDLDIGASGRFAWTAQFHPNSVGSVLVWDLSPNGSLYNAQTGAHTWTGSANPGQQAVALESDPLERFLYVVNQTSSSLSVLAIDSASGQLTPVQTVLTGLTPNALALRLWID